MATEISRVLCLKEGDSNSKCFHRMANSNRRNNSIGSLNIDGVLISSQEVIEEGITRFYKNLYLEDKLHHPHPNVLNFSTISEAKASWLEWPFEEVEIFGVVKDFNGDKAPRPDGCVFPDLLGHY